jgi:rhodanese-related sulfurtransferase
MNKTLKEILIIFFIALLIGLIINAVNPNGVSLIADLSMFEVDSSKVMDVSNIKNDPYDTTGKKLNIFSTTEKTKEGYIKPQNITLAQAKALYDINGLFIDGRKPADFAAGHIKNAINIPYEEFKAKTTEEKTQMMKKFNKEGIIVCYCDGGECDISIDLAYEFAKLGFNSVNIYLGGFAEWENAGYPVER